MSKSTPQVPDYNAAAQTQAASSAAMSEQQTVANRPDINTPFGSQSWSLTPIVDPTTGQTVSSWTQNTTLNPQAQAALDSQQAITQNKSQTAQGLLGQFDQQASKPIDFNSMTQFAGVPGATTTGSNPSASAYDKSAADAAFSSYMGYNQPLQQQASSQLDTQLQNQGLKPGDQAYDTAMTNLRNQQSQATQQAGYGSILTGSQIGNQQAATDLAAQNQGFGQSMSQAGYQNNLRTSQEADAMTQQGFSLNEINSILNGQQIGLPQTPGFSTAGSGQGVQALSAAQSQGQGMLDQSNAQNQQAASTAAGVGSLALTALSFY